MMKIRGHHLLCMRYFQGKGYSKGFVDNFQKVIDKLRKNLIIEVVSQTDVICSKCPHLSNGRCVKKGLKSELRVRKKDELILKYIGLKPGTKLRFDSAQKAVEARLKLLKKSCRNCEWKRYCHD